MSSAVRRPHVMIPVERKKEVNNFDQLLRIAQEFHLGSRAYNFFGDKGRVFCQTLKPIINKKATDENGIFIRSWKIMTSTQQAALAAVVHEREPWLLRYFEGGWATDWALKKMIDQRVSDRTRKGQGKGTRHGKGTLVIYCE